MSPFFIGLAAGMFIGAIFGFSICALMVIPKRADERDGHDEL